MKIPEGMQSPFCELVEQARDHAGGTYRALMHEIGELGVKLDRRKLVRLANGENEVLSVSQLIALNRYMIRAGLGGVLRRPDVWTGIAESRSLRVLVGSYRRESARRNDMSRWDFHAAMSVIDAIHDVRPKMPVTITDILQQGTAKETTEKPMLDRGGAGSGAVVIIGSPRACAASEIALSDFWGVEAFRPGTASVPFAFVWPEGGSHRESAFECPWPLGADVTDGIKHNPSRRRKRQLALRVDNTLYFEHVSKKQRRTFAVIAIKRVAQNSVWAVIAGLTGPGTLAGVQALRENSLLSTAPLDEEIGSGFWAVVEAEILETGAVGDDREIGEISVLKKPSPF